MRKLLFCGGVRGKNRPLLPILTNGVPQLGMAATAGAAEMKTNGAGRRNVVNG
jgi:hypothetical protein